MSYGEARRDFERTRDKTGLDSINLDASESEIFVETGVIAGPGGRNGVET